MNLYKRFRDALHAKPPPQPPLPPGPSRVRDWWQSRCPSPPLDHVRDARERGVSFSEHVEWYFIGGYDLSPEDVRAFKESEGERIALMVAIMSAADEQGVDWPDVAVPPA